MKGNWVSFYCYVFIAIGSLALIIKDQEIGDQATIFIMSLSLMYTNYFGMSGIKQCK